MRSKKYASATDFVLSDLHAFVSEWRKSSLFQNEIFRGRIGGGPRSVAIDCSVLVGERIIVPAVYVPHGSYYIEPRDRFGYTCELIPVYFLITETTAENVFYVPVCGTPDLVGGGK